MGKKTRISEYTEKNSEGMRKKLIEALSAIAFADLTDAAQVRSDGEHDYIEHVNSEDLPEELRFAIKTIKKTKDGIVIELYDKMKALELLGKYFGIFEGKKEHEALITITPEERMILKKYEKRMEEKRNSQKTPQCGGTLKAL